MKVTRWVLRREGGGDSSDLSYGMNCTVGCMGVKYLFVFLFLKNIDLLSLFVFNFIFGVLFIKIVS